MSDLDTNPGATGPAGTVRPRTVRRRLLKGCAWGWGGTVLLFVLLVGLLFVVLNRVPKAYPPPANPIDPPTPTDYAASELDGFESPYLGHTGSWDGKGGSMWGGSKVPDLEQEAGMGLRWTFMPVNWSAMEPEGPVNEPEMYRTHWKGQAADYAEFVTLAAARIKAMDPKAVIVAPGLAAGKHGLAWLEAALDPAAMAGSPCRPTPGRCLGRSPCNRRTPK